MKLGRMAILAVLLVVAVVGAIDGTSPARTENDLGPVAQSAASAAADAYFASGGSEDQASLAARRRVDELDADFVSFAVGTGGSASVTVSRHAASYVVAHLGIGSLTKRFEVQVTAVAAPRAGAPPVSTTIAP